MGVLGESTTVAVVGDLPPANLPTFDELFVRYQNQVHAVAFRVLHNWQDAEDVTQEVLLKAYLRLDDLASPSALWAWLRRITVNACLDLISRRRRRPTTVPLTAPEGYDLQVPEEALRSQSAEEAALFAEEWHALGATLRRLDPTGRDALLLRELHGYSYAEIAAMRNLSLSAAKMRVHRARAAIQHALNTAEPV